MTLLVASVTYRTAGHEFFERMAFEAGDGSTAPLGICAPRIAPSRSPTSSHVLGNGSCRADRAAT
jgi:hypothetical protein